MTVFDSFREEPYTFLAIKRGGVKGDRVVETKQLNGIFKLRSSVEESNNMETRTSTATLHAHPQDFVNYANLVGQGICKDGCSYEIVKVTEGKNFVTGLVEHLTFTLGRATYVVEC